MVMSAAGTRQLPPDQPEQHGERNRDVARVEQRSPALDPRELDVRRLLGDGKAAVVLVHEALSLEAEEVGVGAEEALRVRLAGEEVEALVLERL